MLAYIFWHWPLQGVEAHTYQADLVSYHQTLYAHRPRGLHYTRVLWMEQAAWLERDEPTYEDWHIIENAAALDPLNERAVSGPCQEPHRLIARWTGGSAGGLYRLACGKAHLPVVRCAYRLSKPTSMTYEALYALLQPLVQKANGALWTRQMNLGPGPEFCLHSAEPLVFPDVLAVLKIPVLQICCTLDR